MRLPATPLDFLVVQLDPDGGTVGSTETTATLKAGDGAGLPPIAGRRWLPLLAVACTEPEQATLEQMRAGDWLHVTDVSGDTITMHRTATARTLQPGEYLFLSLSAYQWGFLMAKLEHLEYALSTRFGGYSGVPQWGVDGAPDALKVVPDSPSAMRVKVQAGVAMIGSEVFRLESAWTSGTITAPSSNKRIDLVQAKLGAGGQYDAPSIKTGAESADPSPPDADSDAIPLGSILLTSAHSTIEAEDIADLRTRI
jgi:hypothetical protein